MILVALFFKNVGLIRILVYNFINCNESMFCEAILFTFWTTNHVKFVCIRVWPLVSCLLFQINILKVYLWCYFIDRVSDINMLSMIMILIAFHIKFQYQYFLLILLVRSLLESLLAFFFTYQRFSLAKLVSFYRLYILLNSLLKASVQAKKKILVIFLYM